MNRERRLFARLKKLFNSFYTPTITAVVCFVMIVLLLFNAVTFRSFYNSIRKDIYQQAYMQSQRQTMSFSMLLKEFSQLGAKIATDPNLSLSAFRKSHRNAHTAFKSYDLSFYKYDRIFIYYPGENYLLTPGGTCSPYVAFSGSDNVNLLMEEIGNCSAASGNVVRTNNKTSPELLFLYPSAQRVIIFTLKFSTISSMLTSQESISHQPSEIHMLIKHGGENNLLFCDSDIIQDFGSISEELHSGIKSNSCTEIKLENEPYLAYTDNTSYGLSVIILTKVTTQFDRLKNVMWLDVICCVAILLLGIFVLMFSFKKTYKPIQNVVNIISGATNTPQHEGNEIDVLQNMARNYSLLLNQKNTIATLSQSKKTFLLRLINGNYTDLEVIGNLLSNLEMSFPYPYMFVCIITCASDEQPFSDDVAAFHASQEDSAKWQGYFFSTVEKGTNSSSIGIISCDNSADEYIKQLCSQIAGTFSAKWDTVAAGGIFNSPVSMPQSYSEARTAIDYKMLYGKGNIILYSNLPHESEKSEGIYPRQRLDDISKCMADWDEKEVSKQLNLLLEDIKRKNLPLQQVKCIGIELSSMLIQSFSGNVSEISDFNVFSICEYQTVDELANIISGVSASVSSYLSSKTQLKNSSDIQRIMSIIDDNYDNSQFSLENMCSEFSVTPQTLRRRFKQATGTTMNDYMTNLRIEKAKKLLRSTNLDLSAISSQCGWNDQNVFIRAFKAREGVTPGRFREKVG